MSLEKVTKDNEETLVTKFGKSEEKTVLNTLSQLFK